MLVVSILLEVRGESKCRRATVDTAVWGFGQMMTLRQIEVIRAVMVTGTIGGAAKLLNVSAPGISRLVKYTVNARQSTSNCGIVSNAGLDELDPPRDRGEVRPISGREIV